MRKPSRFRQVRLAAAAGFLFAAVLSLSNLFPPPGEASPTPSPTSSPPAPIGCDAATSLRLLEQDGTVTELTLSDYLWRVVAAEMPASFHPEALKAQAVCARTYTLWKMSASLHGEEAHLCASSSCCQACLTSAQAVEKWGDRAAEYTEKIARAVADTDGRILTYGGKPIQALFFSSSTHSTEDAAAVWGNALPYLVSVVSPEGEDVPNYRTSVILTEGEMRKLAQSAGATLKGPPSQWISKVRLTDSGRVAELTFGDVTLSGGAARTLFGLRSACFSVVEREGSFTFSVTGYGHGVGMSQYGAEAMAREGSLWQDIVLHYYTGVSIAGMPDGG